jgi:hypothetical protein
LWAQKEYILEKGEVMILAVQFAALILVVLFLSGFATTPNAESTPKFGTVYWGNQPGGGVSLGVGSTTVVTTNATTISVFYNLAYSTNIGSFSAERLCVNPAANDTGGSMIYTKINIGFDKNLKTPQNYFYFDTTGQRVGYVCTYTIGLTDSLQQTVTWVGMVELKAPVSK